MRRFVTVLVAVLIAVAGLTAVALRRAGEDRYAGLEEQALALARVLRGAAEEAAATVATAEEHLARRLAAAARRADTEIAREAAPVAEVADTVAREERVGRVVVFDERGKVVASSGTLPLDTEASSTRQETLSAIEREEAEQAIARLKPEPGRTVVEGLQSNAFGTRERFGLAYGRHAGGTLLLRADAKELADLRRRFGLGPVLERTAAMPGVRRVSVVDAEGRVVLGDHGPKTVAIVAIPAGSPAADAVRETPEGIQATARLRLESQPPLFVDLLLSTARADEAVSRSREAILLAAGIAGLLAIGLAGLLVHREARHQRAALAAEQRRDEERRLAEMGALAGLVTHELANPLNAVRLGLRVLEDAPPETPRATLLAPIQEEAARMAKTLEGFLGLARGEVRDRQPVGPEILDRVRTRVAPQAQARHVHVRIEASPDAPSVRADPVVLEQAFTNLVRNAIASSPERETVDLAWRRAEHDRVEVTVTDRGTGLPREGRDALLRVGGTTRPGGHGLGLPLAQRFVRMHGGTLALEDAPEGGARVVVRLPATGGAADA